jgi:hypothetical protein
MALTGYFVYTLLANRKIMNKASKKNKQAFAIHNVSGSDILILLERKFPTVYEIHRKEIRRAENLVLTTTDKEFAERLVNAYNHYR